MSLASPVDQIDIEGYENQIQVVDDLVIVGDEPAQVQTFAPMGRDPIMPFLYLGIISLIAIIATAAYLAL